MVVDLCEQDPGKTKYINIRMSLDEAKRLMRMLPPDSLEALHIARAYARSFESEQPDPGGRG